MGQRTLEHFSAQALSEELQQTYRPRRYVVALSGGCDSVALLHSLHSLGEQLQARLAAIHINHQLQLASDDWQALCERLCFDWNIPLQCVSVDVDQHSGKGLEAAARDERYQVFSRLLEEGDLLLLAHHKDDLVETALLNLFNGAGVEGLSGIPRSRALGASQLYRPLLGFSRAELRRYAVAHELKWIEDPSNEDQSFDRNFIRHQVLPKIESRFPAVVDNIRRSAGHCASVSSYMTHEADSVVTQLMDRGGRLSLRPLEQYAPALGDFALRRWCQKMGLALSATQLGELKSSVAGSRSDSSAYLRLGQKVIRRHSGQLCVESMGSLQARTLAPRDWALSTPLVIREAGLTLEPENVLKVMPFLSSSDQLRVCFRTGGELFQPAGDRHRRSLKTLFQRWAVPPWRRALVPLIYWDDRLVMIYGYAVSDEVKKAGVSLQR